MRGLTLHVRIDFYSYSYNAGIDIRRRNLASTDVTFWRLKSIPALQGLKLKWV